MKKILCLFLPLLMGSAAQAQYGQRLYDLDSLSQEWFNDGLITDQFLVSGKPVYAATGKVQSPTATGALIERSRFARIGFTGATQANRFYYLFYNGAERPSRMNSICEGSNAFLMSGVVYSNNAPGTGDVLLLKTAASGVPQSVRKVDLGGFDESFCTRRSAKTTSKYYTCGSSYVQSSSAAFLMKHNASGSVVNWVRKFSLPCGTTASLAEATSVIDDSLSGNVVVIGHVRSASPSLACQNAFIARFSASGALHWLHFIASNNAANFNLQSIRATNAAQEYVITGSALNPATGKNGILLMRVNTAGAAPAFVFSKLISSPGPTPNFPVSHQAGYDVVSRKDSAGVLSYYVAGQTSYTFGSGDGTMLRADQNGIPVLLELYTGTTTEALYAIDQTSNNGTPGDGLAAFGRRDNYTTPGTAPHPRSWLVKSYFNLISGCYEIADNPVYSTLPMNSTAFQPAFVTTFAIDSLTAQYGTENTLKLCWATSLAAGSNARWGAETSTSLLSGDLSLLLAPNPAKGNQVRLNVSLETNEAEEKAEVRVLDALGRICRQEPIRLQSGENEINLDIEALPPGMYLIRVTTAGGAFNVIRMIRN